MMLELLRGASAALWLVVFVMTIGSATRSQFGHARERDESWTMAWFYSFLQLGWGIRFVVGLAPPLSGPAYDTTCALNVFSLIIAAGLLVKRWQYEGWRW